MKKKLCYYHAVDLDGKCSAAIFRYAHEVIAKGEVELVPFNYGYSIELEKMKGCDVFFLDCNPQPFKDNLDPILANASSLTIIDHHKSLLEDPVYLKAVEDNRISSFSRMGIGACFLVWEAYADILAMPMPESVKLLAMYDAWCKEDISKWDNEILPFQYGVRLAKLNPVSNMENWENLFHGYYVEVHIENGKAILAYEQNRLGGLSRKTAFEATVRGRKAICINSCSKSSMTLEAVYDPSVHELMCVFSQVPNKDKTKLCYSVSFYSTRDDVDCSVLAKELDGGGHKGAAGTMVTSLVLKNNELILN